MISLGTPPIFETTSRSVQAPPAPAADEDRSGVDDTPLPEPDDDRRSGRFTFILGLVPLAVLQAFVVLDLDVPVLRPAAALVTLLAIPTLVLHRRASLPGDSVFARFAHAFGASLLAVVVIALAVNAVLPLVGVSRPLTPLVLGLTWLALDAALLSWRRDVPLLPNLSPVAAARRAWEARVDVAEAAAWLAVVLGVLGAIRLNNGAGGQVALAGHLLVAAAVTALLLREGSPGRDGRVVFLVSLALLLATSLRGWGITGHDIQAEYLAFSLTNDAQHWSMDLLQNAYNACLSVTVLPTVLAQTTALSGVVVFKVVLQVLFALVPVLVLLTSRRFLPRGLALTGVVLLVAFPTFSTDMPYLVRQEVAFLFLGLMLLAGTDSRLGARSRRAWVAAFGVGVVLAHYSTTYLLLLALLAGLVLWAGVRLVSRALRRPRAGRSPLVLLSPTVVVTIAAVSLLWTGPVTDTGDHAGDVARGTIAALLGQGESRPGSSDVSFSVFGGEDASPRARMDMFVAETMELRADAPGEVLLVKQPGRSEKRPRIVDAESAPLTPAGDVVAGLGVDTGLVADVLRFGCAALLQVFLLVGLWRVVVAARRRDSAVTAEHACLAVGLMGVLGLVVVVPSLSVEYGVLRAFLQTMLFLAPVAAVGMWWLLERLGRTSTAWAVGTPVAILLVLTAAAPSLLGGNPARLALHDSGLYHDRYVTADSDVVARERLAEAPDDSGAMPKVITSRNEVLRVVGAGVPPHEVVDRIFPTLLTTGSYVFVDARLARQQEATIFYSGDRITYRYPIENLDRRLDLVYSAGASRVYR